MKKRGKYKNINIEFITIYGWAVLVIILAISVLFYFKVLNNEGLLRNTCSISNNILCEVSMDNRDISVLARNDLGSTLRDAKIVLGDEESICSGGSSKLVREWYNNTITSFNITCSKRPIKNIFKSSFTIIYTESNLTKESRGSIKANVE